MDIKKKKDKRMDLATNAQHDCNKIRAVQMIKDAK